MRLSEGEQILKIYHHHPTPFVYQLVKIIVGCIPFFFFLYLFAPFMSMKWFWIVHVVIFIIFGLIIVYASLLYWLDKLIVTNKRLLFVDWKYLTVRDESEALLHDINDIITLEKGFLSSFKMFDYGTVRVDTPASSVTITFVDAPNPEGIRQFIFHAKSQ